jgi:hypothetical protein
MSSTRLGLPALTASSIFYFHSAILATYPFDPM